MFSFSSKIYIRSIKIIVLVATPNNICICLPDSFFFGSLITCQPLQKSRDIYNIVHNMEMHYQLSDDFSSS